MRHLHLSALLCLPFFALIFLSLPDLSTAISTPAWLSLVVTRTVEITKALDNTCQCECCYSNGNEDQTECVPPVDTSFDVSTCSKCDVDACSLAFPIECAETSSVVEAECIKRKSWMLRLVPIIFIGASIVLLVYGFFCKTYDGYHDENRSASGNAILTEVLPSNYATFANFPSHYGLNNGGNAPSEGGSGRQGLWARSSGLATISENAEIIGPTAPEDLIPDIAIDPMSDTNPNHPGPISTTNNPAQAAFSGMDHESRTTPDSAPLSTNTGDMQDFSKDLSASTEHVAQSAFETTTADDEQNAAHSHVVLESAPQAVASAAVANVAEAMTSAVTGEDVSTRHDAPEDEGRTAVDNHEAVVNSPVDAADADSATKQSTAPDNDYADIGTDFSEQPIDNSSDQAAALPQTNSSPTDEIGEIDQSGAVPEDDVLRSNSDNDPNVDGAEGAKPGTESVDTRNSEQLEREAVDYSYANEREADSVKEESAQLDKDSVSGSEEGKGPAYVDEKAKIAEKEAAPIPSGGAPEIKEGGLKLAKEESFLSREETEGNEDEAAQSAGEISAAEEPLSTEHTVSSIRDEVTAATEEVVSASDQLSTVVEPSDTETEDQVQAVEEMTPVIQKVENVLEEMTSAADELVTALQDGTNNSNGDSEASERDMNDRLEKATIAEEAMPAFARVISSIDESASTIKYAPVDVGEASQTGQKDMQASEDFTPDINKLLGAVEKLADTVLDATPIVEEAGPILPAGNGDTWRLEEDPTTLEDDQAVDGESAAEDDTSFTHENAQADEGSATDFRSDVPAIEKDENTVNEDAPVGEVKTPATEEDTSQAEDDIQNTEETTHDIRSGMEDSQDGGSNAFSVAEVSSTKEDVPSHMGVSVIEDAVGTDSASGADNELAGAVAESTEEGAWALKENDDGTPTVEDEAPPVEDDKPPNEDYVLAVEDDASAGSDDAPANEDARAGRWDVQSVPVGLDGEENETLEGRGRALGATDDTQNAQESTPAVEGDRSAYRGDTPAIEDSTTTIDESTSSIEDDAKAVDEEFQTEDAPAGTEYIPTKQSARSFENNADDTPVIEEGALAVEGDTSAAEKDRPGVEDEKLAVEEDAPAAEDNIPAVNEDSLAAEGDTLAVEEDAPAVEGDTSAVEEGAPAVEGDTSAVEEEAPAVEGEASAVEGDAPAVEDDASAIEEDAPAVEGDASAIEEDAPAVEGDASAVEGAASAVEGDASAVEEDAPAVEGDAPAVEGDASAVEGDVSAVEDDASAVEGDTQAVEEDGTLAAENDIPAVEENAVSAEEDATPAAEIDTPAVDGDSLAAEDDILTAEKDAPAVEEDTLATKDDTLVDEEDALAVEGDMQDVEKDTPTFDVGALAVEDDATVFQENAPASGAKTPNIEDGTENVDEDASRVEDGTGSSEKAALGDYYDTEAVEDAVPIVEGDEFTGEDDLQTVEKNVPVAAQNPANEGRVEASDGELPGGENETPEESTRALEDSADDTRAVDGDAPLATEDMPESERSVLTATDYPAGEADDIVKESAQAQCDGDESRTQIADEHKMGFVEDTKSDEDKTNTLAIKDGIPFEEDALVTEDAPAEGGGIPAVDDELANKDEENTDESARILGDDKDNASTVEDDVPTVQDTSAVEDNAPSAEDGGSFFQNDGIEDAQAVKDNADEPSAGGKNLLVEENAESVEEKEAVKNNMDDASDAAVARTTSENEAAVRSNEGADDAPGF